MNKILKVLFPFSDQYKDLNEKRLHRLMKVVFWFLLLITWSIIVLAIREIVPLSEHNTKKVYIMDNLVDWKKFYNDFYSLECDSDRDMYFPYDDRWSLDYYEKSFWSISFKFDWWSNNENRISKLSTMLKTQTENDNANDNPKIIWDEVSKTADIYRKDNQDIYIYCIYWSDHFEPTNNIFQAYEKSDCSNYWPNVIAISNIEYEKIFNEKAKKMLQNEDDELWWNYKYKWNKKWQTVKMIGLIWKTSWWCSYLDVIEVSPNNLFYIESIFAWIILFYIISLLLQLFYFKVIIYVVYWDKYNNK